MTPALTQWVGHADALVHAAEFGLAQAALNLAYIRERTDDYYISLVGELYDQLEIAGPAVEPAVWAALGNAFAQLGSDTQHRVFARVGIDTTEANFFAATAFYQGGFPASAYLILTKTDPNRQLSDVYRACFELLTHPANIQSQRIRGVLAALAAGDVGRIEEAHRIAITEGEIAKLEGPAQWIPAKLLEKLLQRFSVNNLRAVLPDRGAGFWDVLVNSFLQRSPQTWEFFPSQVGAIRQGLLSREDTFSLQMPTGSGKTALCESLLYAHAQTADTLSVMLVPYRSLASELRHSVAARLTAMGIPTRCVYGGTVSSGDEAADLDTLRVIVATPEALTGLLGADENLIERMSLVVCDEGHLLGGGERGVSLELLLSRFRARQVPPRIVFVSAIVPNIEEVNSWLGGPADTVVKSDYRPAITDFSVLLPVGNGRQTRIGLRMHPQRPMPQGYVVSDFLTASNFEHRNGRRTRTYGFDTHKTRAIAAARKSLALGTVAVFATQKTGNQGAIGLAEELLDQLNVNLSLPNPLDHAQRAALDNGVDYLRREFGPDWIVTRTLAAGAVLHHGDVPQEVREVLERLLRLEASRFAICTSTLAEGVNLPIRTLVLYSVSRRDEHGNTEPMSVRDIRNLVGRAGRAGATTRGLVLCVNPNQWQHVLPVAMGREGQPLTGALRDLVAALRLRLALQPVELDNVLLESDARLLALTDGIDATLVDLAAEELGEAELVQRATQLADQTFASSQATEQESRDLLRTVFALRARRISGMAADRLRWVRSTGARPRLIDSVVDGLAIARADWEQVNDPLDVGMIGTFIDWALTQPDFARTVRDQYRLAPDVAVDVVRARLLETVQNWVRGTLYRDLAPADQLDEMLGVHMQVVAFGLQVAVEQSVALLVQHFESLGRNLAASVKSFPEHLRFGVPTAAARTLASLGVRHRRAAIVLGEYAEIQAVADRDRLTVLPVARDVMQRYAADIRGALGNLVFENTRADIA